MLDPSQLRLGKREPRVDPRSLRLARYLAPDLPRAPQAVDFVSQARLPWGMLLNNILGTCTCTSWGHIFHAATAANGREQVLTDEDILKAYIEACGYDPTDPSTDNGGFMLVVLNYVRRVGIGGHKILGYATVDLKNRELFKQALYLFGSLYLGISLPESAQGQRDWTVAMGGGSGSPRANSWGGHAVSAHGYRDRNRPDDGIDIVTWGEVKRVSWDFVDAYCDEAYAPLSIAWADGDGAPNGFDLARLREDLARVTS